MTACEEKIDWDYSENNLKIMAVESIITNENKKHTVKLTLVRINPNQDALPVTDAIVRVSLAGNNYEFEHDPLNPGCYLSKHPFIDVIGTLVNLHIIHDGIEYSGSDNMIPVSPMLRASFRKLDNEDMYEIIHSSSVFNSNEQAMWEIFIDWSFLPEYQNIEPDSCKARLFFYDLKNIDVGQIFSPPKKPLKFPKGAQVSQSKYSLSNEHAEFRRSLLLETEWRGGMFDVSPGMVYTNIDNDAVGFFGASSVIRDSFYIE